MEEKYLQEEEEMDKKYEALFTPFHIGTCEIKNRVIIPAMEGTNIVDNMAGPRFNEKSHDYYIERAKNDVGLFIPGMIPVYSMLMGKWLHKSPKVFEQARPIVEEIHATGSKVSAAASPQLLQDLREEIIHWHRKC